MRLDFNKVLAVVTRQTPAVIEIDGQDHRLRDITIADAALFDSVQTPARDETEEAYAARVMGDVARVFDGPAPAFLTDPLPADPIEKRLVVAKLNTLVVMIAALIAETVSVPKQLSRARAETDRQIEAARGSA